MKKVCFFYFILVFCLYLDLFSLRARKRFSDFVSTIHEITPVPRAS